MKRTSLRPIRTRRLASLDTPATRPAARETLSRLTPTARRSIALAGLLSLFSAASARAT
jgi:hypothetical protein